jgi:hypothetical protein
MTELEKRVLEEIETRNLTPRPYYVFLAKRSVLWTLAGLSIILGALAFAVLLFAVSDYYATGGRLFDNLPFGDLIPTIPAIWLGSMILFTASAYYALRNTRRGYRYRPMRVVTLCLAVSVGLGVLFHLFEVGSLINDFLASRFAYYKEETYVPFSEWSRPDEGFLGGTVESVDGKKSLHLKDFQDKEWLVDISNATVKFDTPLEDEGDIAIRGTRTGASGFRAETIDSFD